jgi:probable HAF family extracellular repeat protein
MKRYRTYSRFSCPTLIAATLVVTTASFARSEEFAYELFIIEPYMPGSTAEAVTFAVNDAGHATGYATNPNMRPYIWTNETGKIDLGTTSGSGSSTGRDLNATGVVVGWTNSVAAVWWGVNNFQLLPAPTGAFFPFVEGINDANIIVGKANLSSNVTTGFVWDGVNGSRDLRSLGVTNAWNARRINNANQIIGQRLAGNHIAFRFDLDSGLLVTLGTLGGSKSEPLGINNLGHVVGWANNPNLNIRAFRWTSETGMQDLGSLGGQPYDLARAYDINDHGVIAGVSATNEGSARAFIWDPVNGMRKLDDLIDAPHFQLEAAQRISNTGWIAGNGRYTSGGLGRGFVLRPLTSPAIPGDIDGNGVLDMTDHGLFVSVLTRVDTNPDRVSRCDLNDDGVVDGLDIEPFLAALL